MFCFTGVVYLHFCYQTCDSEIACPASIRQHVHPIKWYNQPFKYAVVINRRRCFAMGATCPHPLPVVGVGHWKTSVPSHSSRDKQSRVFGTVRKLCHSIASRDKRQLVLDIGRHLSPSISCRDKQLRVFATGRHLPTRLTATNCNVHKELKHEPPSQQIGSKEIHLRYKEALGMRSGGRVQSVFCDR